MFFVSVVPSEIRRFKFTVSWLSDNHIAADNLRCETSSTSRYDSPLSALFKFKILGSECQTKAKQATKKWQLLVFSKLPSLPSAGSRPDCFHTSLGCEPRSLIRVSLGWFDYSKKCCQRTKVCKRLTSRWLPFANWLAIRGWGRLSVQGADKRVKCSIFNFLRAAVSCVETAHPSSLHVSITWFSYKLSPPIWGIGAWTLRALLTSTSAVSHLQSLTGE
jgi:hypothetical protein